MKISRLLCLFVFGLAACNSRQPGERDAQIEEQRKQIDELSALSKQQSEQIVRLTESLQSKEASAQQEKNRRPAVTGSAYIMRKSADSTILRDLEVVIFRPAVEALWRDSIKDESKYHTEFKGDSFKKFSFDLEMSYFKIKLIGKEHEVVVSTTMTDSDGKFSFSKIPAGDYFIYAYLKTPLSSICWLSPIAIKEGETTESNLTNSTARVIVNSSFR